MEIEKLEEWNPWWEDPKTIEKSKGKERSKYKLLLKSINIKEITIITGIRRSGKSTLMYQMIDNLLEQGIDPKQILFVNLEDQKLTKDSLEDIYNSYKTNINPKKKAYIFLDEIHKKEKWELWIRKKYDQNNNKFVISSSSSYLLKKEYSRLLTGRNLTFDVFPLSFEEFLNFKEIDNKNIVLEKTKALTLNYLKKYLENGGFPEIVLKEKEFKTKILKQYFDDIIFKDVIDRFNSNSKKTEDLALYLATNITNILSLRKIRESLGISYDTIKDYISFYREAFLFFSLDHFSYSYKEQKSSASKIYCIDNGLRNAVSFKFSKDEGKLAENLVFVELKRREENIYYWKEKGEVDFIVKNNNQTLTAINISYTDEINERETRSLTEFKNKFKKTEELILITKNTKKQEKGIKFIPLWQWLLDKN